MSRAVQNERPRDTVFMKRLVYLIQLHNEMLNTPGYHPQKSLERIELRAHVATATEDDIRDMALRRFHEYGETTDADFDDALRDTRESVRDCIAELSD